MKPAVNTPAVISSEERYRLLIDAVSDYAIYMLDRDGLVASWNAGAQRLTGFSEAEILGRHFSKFYEAADVDANLPALALRAALADGRFEAEGWGRGKDGRRFWARSVLNPVFSADGDHLGFARVTRDLTERRAAAGALEQSEERFRLLVDAVTDYALYTVDPQGIVTYWNTGAERAKGYRPHEVIGTSFSRFYRQEEREAGLPMKALAIAAEEDRFESEGWRVRKDGAEFWANVVIHPIRDSSGVLHGFAKITRDITEKREAQFALEHAREALFQSQKLEAIGQLTGGVAHDFNNLLAVVLTSLELLRRRLPDDQKLHALVDSATMGAKRGVTLTQRMLAFARRQELRPEKVDLRSLVEGMTELLRTTLGSLVPVKYDFSESLPPILVDAHQLELAILNLAVNARDAMSEGGVLSLEARQEKVSPNDGQNSIKAGMYVKLAVSDTGSGMSAETLARATEPFFTTKGVGKGTGLGLAMVQGLAGQSGGRLSLVSTEGVGTRAELWLPCADTEAKSQRPTGALSSSAHPAMSLHGLKVVVVDEDSLVLASTAAMLEDMGHVVLIASGAEAALAVIDGSVDVIISDHVMPGVTGAQLFELLEKKKRATPFVLASGYADFGDEVAPRAVRLMKPFNQAQLSAAILEAIGNQGCRATNPTV